MKNLTFLLLVMIFTINVEASELDNIFDEHTSIEKPFSLRDPFENPKFKSAKKEKRQQNFDGVWIDEKKLNENVPLDQINITGVLIGKERRVLMNIRGNDYKMRENDTIGPNGPQIKAILPGGIILVEQITNIYGEAEYIETVIPISK